MSADPRTALATFVATLERHLEASAARRDWDDPSVMAAYQQVAVAFEAYDDALAEAYTTGLPLEVTDLDDEDDDYYEDEN